VQNARVGFFELAEFGRSSSVEDADTAEWREPTEDERARIRAWLRRFIQQRGCSPVGTHPVHRVGVVFFRPVAN
jgi:hypothetical protein